MIWLFTAYYYCLSKISQNSYLREILCTNFTNRVLRWFDRFTAYYYCISRNVKKLISPRVLCTSIKTVLLADLNVLQLVRTVWAKISPKLIFPRDLYTSIINHVLSWFDRFSDYYNCMSKNVTKTHTSTSFVHKVSQNRVLSLFDHLTACYNCMSENFQNSYLREFCAQVSQFVFLADLTI